MLKLVKRLTPLTEAAQGGRGKGSEGQSHKGGEGRREWNGEGIQTVRAVLGYLCIPKFLVTPLLMGLICLFS